MSDLQNIVNAGKTLDGIQAKLKKLDKEIQNLKKDEDKYCTALGRKKVRLTGNTRKTNPKKATANSALKKAVVAYLSRFSGTTYNTVGKTNAEIMAGIDTTGLNVMSAASQLSPMLKNDPEFFNIRRGHWRLAKQGTNPNLVKKKVVRKKAARKTTPKKA
jgi:hypothetical protein